MQNILLLLFVQTQKVRLLIGRKIPAIKQKEFFQNDRENFNSMTERYPAIEKRRFLQTLKRYSCKRKKGYLWLNTNDSCDWNRWILEKVYRKDTCSWTKIFLQLDCRDLATVQKGHLLLQKEYM